MKRKDWIVPALLLAVLLTGTEKDHALYWNCPAGGPDQVAGGWAAMAVDAPYEGLADQAAGSFGFEVYHPGQAFGKGRVQVRCYISADGRIGPDRDPVIINVPA